MPTRTPLDIGLTIRDQRRRLKLDQAELAKRAKVSRSWLIGLEKGSPRAELALILRTLDALGLTLAIEPATAPPQAADIDDILADLGRDPP